MAHEDEYSDAMVAAMDLIWGEGFMAPGGEGNVAKMVEGLDLRDRDVLDIGCGQGRPACILAGDYGARVVATDLEGHLIARATQRAERAGLADRVRCVQVEPGPLRFDDESFDCIVCSGAMTQIEDKLAMYRECLRVLRPGGALRCYDWMKITGDYSADMRYWFELEGLTYAMRTPREHEQLLAEAGFDAVETIDASAWYRAEARREYERLRGELKPRITELLGAGEAAHFIEDWRALCVVCEKGEMLQVYSRAVKPRG